MYVDDFKMAGSPDGVKAGWKLLREGEHAINIDKPKQVDQYLGCKHNIVNHKLDDGTDITRVEWDMEDFLVQFVESYKSLANVTTLDNADTPFILEDDYGNLSRRPAPGGGTYLPLVRGFLPDGTIRDMETWQGGVR